MKNRSGFEIVRDNITNIFPLDDDYVFLAGAGISMNAPSSLPSAREMVRIMLQVCVPQEDFLAISNLEGLRYELIVEAVEKYVDKDLKFLDYLDLATTPNLLHLFLAQAIDRGHHAITTNFDYLIEHALLKIVPTENYSDIHAVITREDFLKYQEPKAHAEAGRRLLFKIHGSKHDAITGAEMRDSLLTTISALGRNKEGGTSFAIESFKKHAIIDMLQNSCLVVLGYSGNDDFDIGPALKEFSGMKRVVWIDHDLAAGTDVECFRVTEEADGSDGSHPSRVDALLAEMQRRSRVDVYKIRGNASAFIETELWPWFFPGEAVPAIEEASEPLPPFSTFVDEVLGNVPLLQKHALAGWLYWKLGCYDLYHDLNERGLQLAIEACDIAMESEFIENLGSYYFLKSDFEQAREYFEQAIESANRLDEFSRMAVFQNNLGEISRIKGQLDEAIECYQDAIDEAGRVCDLKTKATALNNIGWIHHARGNPNAETFFKMALEIDENLGDLASKALHVSNIGVLQHDQKEYEEALKNFKEALNIADQLGEVADKVIFLNNIVSIYKEIGDLKAAIATCFKILEITDQAGLLENKAVATNNLAGFYHDAKLYDEARNYYESALDIARRLGNKHQEALFLQNIGNLCQDQGNKDDAMSFYEDALKIATDAGDRQTSVNCINNIARIYKNNGQLDDALTYLAQALEIAVNINDLRLKDTIQHSIDEIEKQRFA